MINNYILRPVDWLARTVVVASISDISEKKTETATHPLSEQGPFIPLAVYQRVSADEERLLDLKVATADEIYNRYVTLVYLKPWLVAVVFMIVFVIALYFIGELLAAKFGKFVFAQLEKIIKG